MSRETENLVRTNNEDEYCGGNYDESVSECCQASTCCKKFLEFEADTRTIIKYLNLDSLKKNVLIRRYSDIIADYEKKRDCVRFAYRLFQMIVTIGSILTPSLLSIQMTEHVQNNYEVEINISVWVISVFVSISNGIVNLFKLDELYAQCALTCEKLKTLWYKYVTLTEPFENTTHNDSFNLFIKKMEEIIMEQKFAEFVDSKANKNKPKEEELEFDKYMTPEKKSNLIDNIDEKDVSEADSSEKSESIIDNSTETNPKQEEVKINISDINIEDSLKKNNEILDKTQISTEMKKI
jgi:hypothetical protein